MQPSLRQHTRDELYFALRKGYVEDRIHHEVDKSILVIEDPLSPWIAKVADVDQRAFADQGVALSEEAYRDAIADGMVVFSHVTDGGDVLSIASAIPQQVLDTHNPTRQSYGQMLSAIFCAGDCVDQGAVVLDRWAASEQPSTDALKIGRRQGLHSELIRARELWAILYDYPTLTGTVRYENRACLRSALWRETYNSRTKLTGGFVIISSLKADALQETYGPSPQGDRLLLLKTIERRLSSELLWRAGINAPHTPDRIIEYDFSTEEGMQEELPDVLLRMPQKDTYTPEYRRIIDDLLRLGYIGISTEIASPTQRDSYYLRMVHLDILPKTAGKLMLAREKVLRSVSGEPISLDPAFRPSRSVSMPRHPNRIISKYYDLI